MHIRMVWGLLVSLLLLVPVMPVAQGAAAQSAREASLSVTPAAGFVAGQRLTLRGHIGAPGRRQVHVEFHMGRPGDVWRVVPDSGARTRASGRFHLHTRAPSMRGISYRVRSGYLATPAFYAEAVTPTVTLSVEGASHGVVQPGEAHTLVGTATPALPGRTLTFQRRVGSDAWETIGAAPSDPAGNARLSVPGIAAGEVVYRLRAEDWTAGGDRVGWMPSFPTYVTAATERGDVEGSPADGSAGGTTAGRRAAAPPQVTAHSTYKWGRHLFDFDWEYGESLSSRPIQGTRRRGSWMDGSNGTGRVAIYNGAMNLETPSGSKGATWATQQGNAQALGRWETRVGPIASTAPFRIELVPGKVSGPGCAARSITIARVDPAAGTTTIGARGRSGAWARTMNRGVSGDFDAYAVEVKKRSIRWFIDGRPVGKLSAPAAVPGARLSLRIVMEAQPGLRGRTMVDWVRAAPLGAGRAARGGKRVPRGSVPGCG